MSVPQGGVFDITVYQGGSYTRTFALREDDETTPVPLTGWTTAKATIRDKPFDQGGVVLAEFAETVNVALGEVTITLTPSQTVLLEQNAYYDVVLIHTNAVDRLYFVQGAVLVDRRVTVV